MTNRRSFQTNQQRFSRAFQFVPGHVGGRVASAQPVRRRIQTSTTSPTEAISGGGTGIPGTPPTSMRTYLEHASASFGSPISVTLDTPPSGTTSAIGLFHSTSFSSIVLPAGWTQVLAGSHGTADPWGSIKRYVVAKVNDWTGSEGLLVDYQTPVDGSRYSTGAAAYAYFQGGGAGNWSILSGPAYAGQTSYKKARAGFTAVSGIWVQFAACSGIYTVGTPPSGVSVDQGFAAGYVHPARAVQYSGAAFDSAMAAPKPASEFWEYNNIGAYGVPNSVAFAAVWAAA